MLPLTTLKRNISDVGHVKETRESFCIRQRIDGGPIVSSSPGECEPLDTDMIVEMESKESVSDDGNDKLSSAGGEKASGSDDGGDGSSKGSKGGSNTSKSFSIEGSGVGTAESIYSAATSTERTNDCLDSAMNDSTVYIAPPDVCGTGNVLNSAKIEEAAILLRERHLLQNSFMTSHSQLDEIKKSITCGYCCNVCYEPVCLSCGDSFCQECFIEFGNAVTGFDCPACSQTFLPSEQHTWLISPDEVLTTIHALFPLYNYYRKLLSSSIEKRMFLELSVVREKLLKIRIEFMRTRQEKMDSLQQLKEQFYTFIKATKREANIERGYLIKLNELSRRQVELDTFYPLTAERVNQFSTFPTGCCLMSLIEILESKFPPSVEAHAHVLAQFTGSVEPDHCRVCGQPIQLSCH